MCVPIHEKKKYTCIYNGAAVFTVPTLPGNNRTMQGPCEDMLTTAYNNPADVKTGRQSPRGGA